MSEKTRRQYVSQVLEDTLSYSRRSAYSGHNKHDGLNSPILRALFSWGKWPRLLAIQLVMRFPFNIRRYLGVPHTRNPKGIGLFVSSYLDRYALSGREEDLKEACALLNWLLENPSEGFSGLSWGYPYPWQDTGFFAPACFPNRVVTCWIGFAFAKAFRLTGKQVYGKTLGQIVRFLTEEPNVLHDSPPMKCYSYVPDPRVNWAVVDVPALTGAFLAEAGELLGCPEYVSEAKRLIQWVLDKQTEYGAWFYAHPPRASHITHDNYHTGIILDCLDRYRQASGDESVSGAWERGLEYYRNNLFTQEGAPCWRNNREFPYDIHSAASGILCFTRAGLRDPRYSLQAQKILDWALANMYDGRGCFFYQKTRFITKRFSLMRWSNAWMCRALAYWLRS